MENPERLVVVSNRLPATLRPSGDGWRTEHSAGGLATAMNPILQRTGGIWIGWPGDSTGEDDPKRQEVVRRWAERDRYYVVDLPAAMAKLYYEGYANQMLWPLFHYFPNLARFSPEAWQAYIDANRCFCDVVVKHHQPDDLIWVHDYHLMLLPQMLREALPEARIGFFLHIPFPSSEVFRILPRRDELLNGLLGADLLAFHTHSHLQHFRNSLLRVLGLDSRIDRVEIGGRTVRFEGLPIGIAPQEFIDALKAKEAQKYRGELSRRFHGRRLLVAVDRLDYTKGIPERLRAFRRLLEANAGLRGQVVLVQVAIPSREDIHSYASLRSEVNELVGDINGHFSTPDWTPVVYIRRSIPRSQLVALYSAADVGWVTPLRDGMNLVAKEYVATKSDSKGALVLSEFAGAAEEMGEAFSVNPYDEERMAAVLDRVLSLPEQELGDRMHALHARVLRNNVFSWADRFLATLREAAVSRTGAAAGGPGVLSASEVVSAYRNAQRRAMLLDYDGTLVPYAPRPEGAVPGRRVLDLLARIAGDPANRTVLISGRRRADLDRWFGDIPGLWLAAEHGALLRDASSREWHTARANLPSGWKQPIRPILEHFVDRTPGSLIEEKDYALVWHYRMAEPEFGEWLANELVTMLEGMLADTELRAVRGRKTVEVKPAWANKGEVVEQLLRLWEYPEFRFATGDDRTDEDMFARLDEGSWTVHVGTGPSRARFAVTDSAAVLRLLDQFVQSRQLTGGVGA